MEAGKIDRKTLRALLSNLRENAVYNSRISLTDQLLKGNFLCTVKSLEETSVRDLEERRIMRVICSEKLPDSLHIRSSVLDTDFIIPAEIEKQSGDHFEIAFNISLSKQSSRRKHRRQDSYHSFFSPIYVFFPNEEIGIPGFARPINSDPKYSMYRLRISAPLEDKHLINSELMFFSEDNNSNPTSKICSIRNIEYSEVHGHQITTADVLVKNPISDNISYTRSIFKIRANSTITLRPLLSSSDPITFHIEELFVNGFKGKTSAIGSLPDVFNAFLEIPGLSFSVTKTGSYFNIILSADSTFYRTKWYNYLTTKADSKAAFLAATDSRDITRLLIESGNKSKFELSNYVVLHGFLNSKWPSENASSGTRYRWIGRDVDGQIIGHTAAIQLNTNLWAAIDNIGSQSSKESWNSNYVADWILTFQELLKYSDTKNPLIQWTYFKKGKVWEDFEAKIVTNDKLCISKDTLWNIYFDDVKYELIRKGHLYSAKETKSSSINKNEYNGSTFLDILDDSYSNSSFYDSFKNEYGFNLKRFFFDLYFNNKKIGILTFNNYPFWISLNQTHNWLYIFVRNTDKLQEESINHLVQFTRSLAYRYHCLPSRIAIIDNKNLYPLESLTNLTITPDALTFAAEVAKS